MGTALRTLRPEGVWDPVRPVIFRPDVMDDSAWQDGFDDGFITTDRALIYGFGLNVGKPFLLNTDLVRQAELKSVKDLLDPKWKGKVIWADVRTGFTYFPLAGARFLLGPAADDVIKRLLVDQEPLFLRDNRQIAEAMTRGRYWLATGAPKAVMQEFRTQGLAKNLRDIDLPDTAYASSSSILLLNRAPHPNAAKLFINWLLTREGQTAWCTNLEVNSRRKDVAVVDPETVPAPGVRYVLLDREQNFAKIEETQKLLLDLVGLKN
ncbi:MAG: extracellular solute-binding protein [Chloroflexota bacterium]